MKKYIHKGISLFLVMSMSVWCLTGCNTDMERRNTEKKDTIKEVKVDESELGKLLSSKMGDGTETEKKETVFVEMKADGTVSKTTVSDKLQVSGAENICDISNLEDIKNLDGDEKFTNEDGNLIWENKGKDISYQGTTTESTPVTINITYYLDGEKIEPEQLAGQSGKIKIVYEYINHSENEEDFVPFIMLTGMVLGDCFTNVEIDNGKVMDYDDAKIVIGYGAPGFKDHLIAKINNAEEYLKDIDIPESFTLTADVKDFEMNMALTLSTSELGEMNLEKTLDFSDIDQQMDALAEGTNELEKGATSLQDGAKQLKDGSVQVNDGAKDIAKYTADLYLGTTKLLTNYKIFNKSLLSGVKSADKGAKKLYAGTKSIKLASKDLDDGAKSLNNGAKNLDAAATKLDDGANSVSSGLTSVKEAFEDQKDSQGNVKAQGLNNGSKALAQGAKNANAGVKELVGTLQGTQDLIQAQIDGVIKQVSTATGGVISSEVALNQTVEGIENAVTNGMELSVVLQANGLNANAYYQLVQAYYSIQTLNTVKATFEAQMNSKASDIKALLDGMNVLERGASDLNSGIDTLYNGIAKLNTGASDLASGTSQMADGTKTLSKGTKTLSDGTGKLKTGAGTLNKGMKELAGGTKKMREKLGVASPQVKEGIASVDIGAGKISAGAKRLAKGTDSLGSGMITLLNGTKTLKDGVIQLNQEGISKITSIFGDDAKNALNIIEDVLNNGKEYKSFTGINENMTGSVRFVFKTAEIKSDK